MLEKLRRMAKPHNIEVVDFGNGHIQLRGPLTVNYYPYSKKQSAYVARTIEGKECVSPKEAIKMCLQAPEVVPKIKREGRRNYSSRKKRRYKEELLRIDSNCHWCRKPLTMETATIEHIIPLYRGGLDNRNNMTLACVECNMSRGHNMPEITNGQNKR